MLYFLDTIETIDPDVGFSLFDRTHLCWLAVLATITLLSCFAYRRFSDSGKRRWKLTVAGLLLLDECFKWIVLLVGKRVSWSYLPLHLCSMNLFFVAWHAWKPSRFLDNFLYTVCVPGAIAALLFPSWSSLPVSSAMHIHSFTTHILLVLYPLALTVSGEIKPDWRMIPQCIGLLMVLAVPIYGLNRLLGTNFMFLMHAEPGNPLYLFAQMWGNHLLGFPVMIAGALVIMHIPIVLYRKCK